MQVKDAKKFDGVQMILDSAEYDCFMFCLEEAQKAFLKHDFKKEAEHCKKLADMLTAYSYFDLENKEVHARFGYRELETLLAAFYVFFLPDGESENGFEKASVREEPRYGKIKKKIYFMYCHYVPFAVQ